MGLMEIRGSPYISPTLHRCNLSFTMKINHKRLICFKVSAKDADENLNGKVLYFLSHEAHGAFTVDENTGVITTSAPLDREKLASYSFQVFAVDLSPAAPRNSTAQVNKCHILKDSVGLLNVR